MLRDISAWHVLLILIVFLVLFGYKKLPDATRSLGRSMRILKSEVRGLHDDEPRKVEVPRAVPPTETDATASHPSPPPAPAEPVRAHVEHRSDSDRA